MKVAAFPIIFSYRLKNSRFPVQWHARPVNPIDFSWKNHAHSGFFRLICRVLNFALKSFFSQRLSRFTCLVFNFASKYAFLQRFSRFTCRVFNFTLKSAFSQRLSRFIWRVFNFTSKSAFFQRFSPCSFSKFTNFIQEYTPLFAFLRIRSHKSRQFRRCRKRSLILRNMPLCLFIADRQNNHFC